MPGASASLNEEEVELIGELVHPHHHAEETLVEEEPERGGGEGGAYAGERDTEWAKDRPWWRRPSPWW